jgi:hypothetical protein
VRLRGKLEISGMGPAEERCRDALAGRVGLHVQPVVFDPDALAAFDPPVGQCQAARKCRIGDA